MTRPNVFIKDPGCDWEQASTLEQAVIQMFERKETDTPEFQALLTLYGRPKLEAIWRKHKGHAAISQATAVSS